MFVDIKLYFAPRYPRWRLAIERYVIGWALVVSTPPLIVTIGGWRNQ